MKFRKKNGIFFKTLIWIWLGLLAASQIVNLITCWLIGSQWDTLPTDWLVAHNLLTRTLVILDICKRYILWWKSVARHCWFPLITAIFSQMRTFNRSVYIKIFHPGRMYMCTLPPPIYVRSIKWKKTINEMGGNIPGGVWWVEIFQVRIFPGEIFLEPYNITYWVFIKGVSGGGDGDFLKISCFRIILVDVNNISEF